MRSKEKTEDEEVMEEQGKGLGSGAEEELG